MVDASRRSNVGVKRHRRSELDDDAVLRLDDVTALAAVRPEVEADTVGNVARRHLQFFVQDKNILKAWKVPVEDIVLFTRKGNVKIMYLTFICVTCFRAPKSG